MPPTNSLEPPKLDTKCTLRVILTSGLTCCVQSYNNLESAKNVDAFKIPNFETMS